MKILYFDCFYGIKENSVLEAMLNLGASSEYIEMEIAKLQKDNADLNDETDLCTDGLKILLESSLDRRIKELGTKIINNIAESYERLKKSGVIENSYRLLLKDFLNIVRVAAAIDNINPDKIISSRVEIGSGADIRNGGKYPIPDMVTVELVKGMPIKSDFANTVTTSAAGAAIISSIADEFSEKREFTIRGIGYGRLYEREGHNEMLRVYLADDNTGHCDIINDDDTGCLHDRQYILECNIDDMNSEIHDFIMTKLFKAGAADAYYTPIIMKKGRPAVKISVLCSVEKLRKIEEILLTETTTFGVRRYEVEKTMLQRTFSKVNTPYGAITVKRGFYKGEEVKAKLEYEECKKAAEEYGIPISKVYKECNRLL